MTGPPAGDPSFWAGTRVLVTGATGMVGSWLCRRLVDAGSQVVALVRDADPQSELLRSGLLTRLHVVAGSLEDYDTVERAVNEHEVDTVFHLGAQTLVGPALRSPRPTLAANVMGTVNVLEAARVHAATVERVVVASSDKAYGERPVLPYTEDMELAGRHPYEVSKSAADLVAQAYAASYGTPVAIARCGNIYGGGDLNWSRIVPGTVRAALAKEPLVLRSDGTFVRDYIFVDDVVEAYLVLGRAITTGAVRGRAFNFSMEQPRTVLEMHDAVYEALGAERIEPVVAGSARGEIHDQYLDASRARRELDWEASYTLEAGLARTVGWYRELLSDAGASCG